MAPCNMHNDYILCCASLTGAPCTHGQRGHRAPQSSPRASRRPRSRLELELPCFHGRLRAWEPSLGWGGCWRVRGRGSSLRLEVALHQVLRTAGWQRLIILRTPRGTVPTPVVVAAGRDPQHAAHGAHGEGGLVGTHQFVDAVSVLSTLAANQAVAFARMARSICRRRFSRRSRGGAINDGVYWTPDRRPGPRSSVGLLAYYRWLIVPQRSARRGCHRGTLHPVPGQQLADQPAGFGVFHERRQDGAGLVAVRGRAAHGLFDDHEAPR